MEETFWSAVRAGDTQAVRDCIQSSSFKRSLPEEQDDDGLCSLHMAARDGHTEVCEVLLTETSCDPSTPSRKGRTPLHFASQGGYEGCASLLLGKGAKVEDTDWERGWTALHFAAAHGCLAIISLLHLHKCRMSLDKNGENPAFGALKNKTTALSSLTLLFEYWPSEVVASKTKEGDLLLHRAARDGGDPAVLRFLIGTCGILVDATNLSMWTALHFACAKGHAEVVQCLLELGADRNALNEGSDSPVLLATFFNFPAVLQILLEAGATKDIPDKKCGKIALNYAEEKDFAECARLLRGEAAETERAAEDDSISMPTAPLVEPEANETEADSKATEEEEKQEAKAEMEGESKEELPGSSDEATQEANHGEELVGQLTDPLEVANDDDMNVQEESTGAVSEDAVVEEENTNTNELSPENEPTSAEAEAENAEAPTPMEEVPRENSPEDIRAPTPEQEATVPEHAPECVPESTDDTVPEEVTENEPEIAPEPVAEDVPEPGTDDTPAELPEDVPDGVPEPVPEDIDIPETTNDPAPETVPEAEAEDTPAVLEQNEKENEKENEVEPQEPTVPEAEAEAEAAVVVPAPEVAQEQPVAVEVEEPTQPVVEEEAAREAVVAPVAVPPLAVSAPPRSEPSPPTVPSPKPVDLGPCALTFSLCDTPVEHGTACDSYLLGHIRILQRNAKAKNTPFTLETYRWRDLMEPTPMADVAASSSPSKSPGKKIKSPSSPGVQPNFLASTCCFQLTVCCPVVIEAVLIIRPSAWNGACFQASFPSYWEYKQIFEDAWRLAENAREGKTRAPMGEIPLPLELSADLHSVQSRLRGPLTKIDKIPLPSCHGTMHTHRSGRHPLTILRLCALFDTADPAGGSAFAAITKANDALRAVVEWHLQLPGTEQVIHLQVPLQWSLSAAYAHPYLKQGPKWRPPAAAVHAWESLPPSARAVMQKYLWQDNNKLVPTHQFCGDYGTWHSE